ncbi:hypothetical protein GGI12_004880 [Dipsacomyces acuminosporus]|nr:hypothetical protein GGI12_004880 [Dipsacomyces acuminosporus]
MSSIASILIDEPPAGLAASRSRASSLESFAYAAHSVSPPPSESDISNRDSSPESCSYSPSVVFAANSRLPSPSSSPSLSAATAAATANRRRKVLISRPPNSFILYRSDKLRELIQQHPELKQTDISKMCADNWKNETPEVKEYYRVKQQEAKARFLSEQAIEVQRISGGRTDKGAIKRIQPTNTFIRYRTEMKKKLAKQFATMNQKDVSRACGLMWRSEPEHVKMRYRQSYNQEKRDFERLCITSTLEPSEEARAALASVMASINTKPSTDAGAAPAASRPAPATNTPMAHSSISATGYRS